MSYLQQVLSDSPVFYMRGDCVGTGINGYQYDIAGNHHDFGGGASSVFGQAAVRPNALYSVDLSSNTGSPPLMNCLYGSWMDLSSFSFDCWINCSNVTSYHAIVSRDYNSPRGWTFYVTGGKLNFFDSTGTDHLGSTTLSTGTAYHVGFSYGSGTAKVFVNGNLDGTFTGLTVNNASSLFDMFIGISKAGTTGSYFFPLTGKASDWAYYSGVLPDARFLAHYNAGISRKTTGWGRPAFAA